MYFFEFLHPDKSPQNARMPKRLNTLKKKKRQPTHTPHQHHKKNTPEVSQCAKIQGFRLSKTTLQVSTYPTKHPEVSQCVKIRGFGLSKTTLQVSTYPTKHPEVSQCAKIQGFGLSKTTLRVSTYPTKHPEVSLYS